MPGEAAALERHPKREGGGTPLPLPSSHSIIFCQHVPLITPRGKPADMGVGNTDCAQAVQSQAGEGYVTLSRASTPGIRAFML